MGTNIRLTVSLGLLMALVCAGEAHAQSLTTGAIQGRVTDEKSGEPLAAVTVVTTSTALQGTQTAITDENGTYKITNLPPGTYVVTFYYGDATVRRGGVYITTNRMTPVIIKMNTEAAGGEVIEIAGKAPTIDPTSTTQGITIDDKYLKNIPVPGRSFDSALGGSAGSQNDGVGVSFSGSTSLENQYVVDGVNTTSLGYGSVGSSVLNSFIEEIEVLTGGYNAEYGRATGGVVNVVTKQGSNEFKGEAYTYFSNSLFQAKAKTVPNYGAPIIGVGNIDYALEVGGVVGGPIIKDKLWYIVGLSPTLLGATVEKTVRRNADCRGSGATPEVPFDRECTRDEAQQFGDGARDEDPETGIPVLETVDTSGVPQSGQSFPFFTKINYAPLADHQGQVSVTGAPEFVHTRGINGDPDALANETKALTTDVAAKWTSKFNDSKTEFESKFGWHRSTLESKGTNRAANGIARENLLFGDLGTWSQLGFESNRTRAGCRDSTDRDVDIYPDIVNCPDGSADAGILGAGSGYAVGGSGPIDDDKEERFSGALSATHRQRGLGNHEFKAGVDIELNSIEVSRQLSGGKVISNRIGEQIDVLRFVDIAPPGSTSSRYDDICELPDDGDPTTNDEAACDFTGTPKVGGETVNWSAYLRDSWQILPNFTVNPGIRYEEQRLRYAEHLRGEIDPLTLDQRNKNAMVLKGMWAPRIGAIYDWTKEGRSKVFANWSRYYESIPLNINNRSFGGEALYRQRFDATPMSMSCGSPQDGFGGFSGENCSGPATDSDIPGAFGVLVQPGIKAQYLDETSLGAEYELLEDLKIGIAYRNRRMGRIIEDVSTDNANSYIIANPGEFSGAEERRLESEIAALDESDPKRQQLQENLDMFRGIRLFDKARRDYHAIELTASRRFSNDLYIQGNYTYSVTRGNYPGLFSADNGQIDPNITSQFDLIELLANRDGPLPQDRPHQFKVDGYKVWDAGRIGKFITGLRLRLLSGTPTNALARHYRYGFDESFLLPRGAAGRTKFTHSVDVHLQYDKELAKNYTLSFFLDAFRVFNNQDESFTDQSYTFSNANPIVGGSYEDLIYLKRVSDTGNETGDPVTRNENYRNTTSRYAPFFMRFGARLTF